MPRVRETSAGSPCGRSCMRICVAPGPGQQQRGASGPEVWQARGPWSCTPGRAPGHRGGGAPAGACVPMPVMALRMEEAPEMHTTVSCPALTEPLHGILTRHLAFYDPLSISTQPCPAPAFLDTAPAPAFLDTAAGPAAAGHPHRSCGGCKPGKGPGQPPLLPEVTEPGGLREAGRAGRDCAGPGHPGKRVRSSMKQARHLCKNLWATKATGHSSFAEALRCCD